MKYSGLIFTTLALSYSVANAASESTFSGGTLHIPHVVYAGAIYDVTMKFKAPDKLILQSVTPLQAAPENPAVEISESLSFKLVDIAIGGQSFRANVKVAEGAALEFAVSSVGLALHGKMIVGEKITALGWLVDGSFSYAYGVSDDGGSIAGRSRNAERDTIPVLFDFEQKEIVGLEGLPGGRNAVRGVNNGGAMAGYGRIEVAEDAPTVNNAFYIGSDHNLVNIGTLGDGVDSRAYAINNNDVVVGWSASQADNKDHVAFSYDDTGMTALGGDILGGERSFAFAVNDSNQIAGVATTADGSAVAFLYDNGTATNLGSLDDSGYSEARGINDKGQTTGWSLTKEGTYQAFMHDGTTMKQIPGLGGDTKGYGINTHGHVVGDARDAEGGRHAFLYKDGQLIDLYSLLPEADKAKWKELREAFSISDDGIVVGRGRYWRDKANGKNSSMAFRLKL